MTENTECSICIEKYNKKLRQKIKCQYCDFEACKNCFQKYILNESFPKCMNNSCDKEWTRQYLKTVFPQSFINKDLKKHRESILFDQERALLPATQPIVEQRNIREQRNNEIAQIRKEIQKLYTRMYELQNLNLRNRCDSNNEETRERSHFVRACPDPECRGFLSSQWKCGLCNKWSCSTCHEVKGLERNCDHVCNPDNVATANLLNQDTKPCPNCATGIFKIEGCDQMWCTQCHTAFSWRTGRIETNIHNPHYYEWMRRNGTLERNINDVQCGRELNDRFIRDVNYTLTRYYEFVDSDVKDKVKKFIENCRNIIHMRYVDLPRYNYNHENNNLELRIKYLQNKIDVNGFKRNLQIQDKKNQKKREINNVLRLMIDTVTDIAYRFNNVFENPSWDQNCDILNEIDEIRKYVNDCLHDISTTYSSIRYCINKKLLFTKYVNTRNTNNNDTQNVVI